MTPLNYAARAIADVRKVMHQFPGSEPETLATMCRWVEQSQHFQLPVNGRLFDDDLRGLQGRKLQLPFKSLTVEYQCTAPDSGITKRRGPGNTVLKHMLLAYSMPADTAQDFISTRSPTVADYRVRFAEGGVMVAFFMEIEGEWTMHPLLALVPADWQSQPNASTVGMIMVPLLHQSIENYMDRYPEIDMRHLAMDVTDCVYCLLDFCEAMTCSNVHPTVLQPVNSTVAARRARDGKLPLFETKVLMVDVSEGSVQHGPKGPSQGGHHRSPRQHLRRGHIRVYRKGLPTQYNKWVQQMVVGDRKKGVIEKTYVLTNSTGRNK